MLNHTTDQLIKTLDVCFIHQYRLNEAANKLEHLFPLNEERYFACSSDEVAFIDQLIFRFAKLQDMIGDKLLRQVLAYVGENMATLTFIDILNKAEKFGLVNKKDDWMELRKIRNDVSHDYPVLSSETTAALNMLIALKVTLEGILKNCVVFLTSQGFNYIIKNNPTTSFL